jgi:hypothetical protein
MILLAFDVDGTLSTSAGPVPFDLLVALKTAGMPVAVVSPSGAWPKVQYPELDFANPDQGRQQNLMRARQAFAEAVVRLYVSDNPNEDELAQQAGFLRILPPDFVKGVSI